MDTACVLCILAVVITYRTFVAAQERTDIGNHVIHKVFKGKPCDKHRLDGGKVKFKLGDRLAKYICSRDFTLVGDTMSVCVDGQWSHQKPVCAAAGCPATVFQTEGVTQTNKGKIGSSVVAYDYTCQPGYHGDNTMVYCNGRSWVGTRPMCIKIQGISCDFDDDLAPGCDQWVNDEDHDIYWKWHTDETMNEGTGPSYDHTQGKNGSGHYLYVDSSKAVPGHVARLYSMTLYPEIQWCVGFWYHMYGEGADGTLTVSTETKAEESRGAFEPIIYLEGNHGNTWQYATAEIPKQTENFMVLFQATMNSSTRNDIGIDDVSVMPCKDMTSPTQVVIVTQETTTLQPVTNKSVTSTSDFSDITVTSQSNASSTAVTMVTQREAQLAGLHSAKSDTNFPIIAGTVGGAVFLMLCLAAVLHQVVRWRTRQAADNEERENDNRAFAYTQYNNDSSV